MIYHNCLCGYACTVSTFYGVSTTLKCMNKGEARTGLGITWVRVRDGWRGLCTRGWRNSAELAYGSMNGEQHESEGANAGVCLGTKGPAIDPK